jgi:phosphoheptose isomerase
MRQCFLVDGDRKRPAYELVFARQLSAYAWAGDIFLSTTTSGSSLNILRASEATRKAKSMSLVYRANPLKRYGRV